MRRKRNRKFIGQLKRVNKKSGLAVFRTLGYIFFHVLRLLKKNAIRSTTLQPLVLKPSWVLRILSVSKIEKFVIKCTGKIIPNFIFEKSFKNGSQIILVVREGRIRNVAKTKIKNVKIIANLLPKNNNVPELADQVPMPYLLKNEIKVNRLSPIKINIPTLSVNFNLNEIETE